MTLLLRAGLPEDSSYVQHECGLWVDNGGSGTMCFPCIGRYDFSLFFLSFLSSGWRPGFAHAEFGSVHAPIYSLAVVLYVSHSSRALVLQ